MITEIAKKTYRFQILHHFAAFSRSAVIKYAMKFQVEKQAEKHNHRRGGKGNVSCCRILQKGGKKQNSGNFGVAVTGILIVIRFLLGRNFRLCFQRMTFQPL